MAITLRLGDSESKIDLCAPELRIGQKASGKLESIEIWQTLSAKSSSDQIAQTLSAQLS